MRRAAGTGSVWQPKFKDRRTGKVSKSRFYWISYTVPGQGP